MIYPEDHPMAVADTRAVDGAISLYQLTPDAPGNRVGRMVAELYLRPVGRRTPAEEARAAVLALRLAAAYNATRHLTVGEIERLGALLRARG
jgi:hypothetical protein